MSNLLLAHNNRANSCTLSNGSWVSNSTLSLDNLKDEDIDKVARSGSVGTVSTRFAADLGAAYPLRVVALINHNLTAATATVRVKAGTAAPDSSNVFATGQVYDSGVVNAKRMTLYGDTPSDWGAQYAFIQAFNTITARYVTVDIDDMSNPASYVQIGRLFIGDGFQPTVNAKWGLQDVRYDLAEQTQSKTGKKFFMKWGKRRGVEFVMEELTQAEGDRVHEMEGALGLSEEVLYVPDPADAALTQRYGFLGLLESLDPMEYPVYGRRSKPVRLIEKK